MLEFTNDAKSPSEGDTMENIYLLNTKSPSKIAGMKLITPL